MRFVNISNYLKKIEGGKYWLVIPKEWDKITISREEYLSIKWELTYKEMMFENHRVMLRFPRWNYSQQMRYDIK